LLVSGDAAGSIIYWSLLAPDPSKPVTNLEYAHEDAVFSLSFHPLGHILCSGSKDFTARFWSRARPVGGQEIDRWHIGEEKAMGAKMEAEMGGKRRMGPVDEEGTGASLPGLAGLPGLAVKDERKSETPSRTTSPNGTAAQGFSGLPGLGGSSFHQQGPPPPVRSWGADGEAIGRPGGPLPSQDEMLRRNAGRQDDDRRRQGYGGGGGGPC
jgi:polyadenylation factor subunit 2